MLLGAQVFLASRRPGAWVSPLDLLKLRQVVVVVFRQGHPEKKSHSFGITALINTTHKTAAYFFSFQPTDLFNRSLCASICLKIVLLWLKSFPTIPTDPYVLVNLLSLAINYFYYSKPSLTAAYILQY